MELGKVNKKVFLLSFILFFVTLTNPRDFPIHNLPLIYPTFGFIIAAFGWHAIAKSYHRVKFLIWLFFGYYIYLIIIRVVNGYGFFLSDLPYLIEPVMIILSTGMIATNRNRSKVAVWAFVSVVTFSAACGLWIILIGEPIASFKSILQYSIGGDLTSGVMLRDWDIIVNKNYQNYANAGLALTIFAFSYQLSTAMVIVITSIISNTTLTAPGRALLFFALLVLLIGTITNSERATVVSAFIGLVTFILLVKGRSGSFLLIFISLTSALLVWAAFSAQPNWYQLNLLQNRDFFSEKTFLRFYMVLPALESLLIDPLGAGGPSAHYIDVAFAKGWYSVLTGAHAPHNHFVNVIMGTGIVGIILTIFLFKAIFKKIAIIKRLEDNVEGCKIAAASVACIVHSFSHNAGFFGLEPATLITLTLMWGFIKEPVLNKNPSKTTHEINNNYRESVR